MFTKDANMKKLYQIALFSSLTLITALEVCAKSQDYRNIILGANPYTYSPQYFTADNDITGRYWAGNKQYPAKAFIGEEEYTNIVVIEKSKINEKSKRKLRKHKDYLGSYIDETTQVAYNLYGEKKYPDKINDAPDADVITMIAIKEDFGIDE